MRKFYEMDADSGSKETFSHDHMDHKKPSDD